MNFEDLEVGQIICHIGSQTTFLVLEKVSGLGREQLPGTRLFSIVEPFRNPTFTLVSFDIERWMDDGMPYKLDASRLVDYSQVPDLLVRDYSETEE